MLRWCFWQSNNSFAASTRIVLRAKVLSWGTRSPSFTEKPTLWRAFSIKLCEHLKSNANICVVKLGFPSMAIIKLDDKGQSVVRWSFIFRFNVAPTEPMSIVGQLHLLQLRYVVLGFSCRTVKLVFMKKALKKDNDSVSFHFRMENFPINRNGRTTKVVLESADWLLSDSEKNLKNWCRNALIISTGKSDYEWTHEFSCQPNIISISSGEASGFVL